jgi:hypothetical protein
LSSTSEAAPKTAIRSVLNTVANFRLPASAGQDPLVDGPPLRTVSAMRILPACVRERMSCRPRPLWSSTMTLFVSGLYVHVDDAFARAGVPAIAVPPMAPASASRRSVGEYGMDAPLGSGVIGAVRARAIS